MTEYEIFEHKAQKQNAETESQIGDRTNAHENSLEDEDNFDENSEIPIPKFKILIIDCSPINFIDSVGIKTINQVKKKFFFSKLNSFLAGFRL